MKKIAFYANNLTERGTGVTLFDYARYSRDLLGNETLFLYDQDFPGNHPKVVQRYQAEFELIPCSGFTDVDAHISREKCDLMYAQKAGKRDDLVSNVVPTMVHAVFPATVGQVHGASYAFVSEWLSDHCSAGYLPWVPHVVSVGDTDQDMRSSLGIPDDALVFGCYGGRKSFDIAFVKEQVIPRVLDTLPHAHFAFMNIEKFIDHQRVIFLPASADMEEKAAFINTCDAMLHARRRGETFGLAVGEFSLRDKPVLTFGRSRERAHLRVLGDTALVYRTADELYDLIVNFDRSSPSARDAYQSQFTPEPVMQKFADHLIAPAERDGFDGAQRRLGLRRWNPFLLARPKVRKLWNQL